MKAFDYLAALPIGSQIGFAVQVILLMVIVGFLVIRPFREDLRG